MKAEDGAAVSSTSLIDSQSSTSDPNALKMASQDVLLLNGVTLTVQGEQLIVAGMHTLNREGVSVHCILILVDVVSVDRSVSSRKKSRTGCCGGISEGSTDKPSPSLKEPLFT